MKKALLLAIVATAFTAGCAQFPYQTGNFYTDATAPFQATNNATGTKMGEACMSNILGIISTGDASIDAAAKMGGVASISTVDTSFFTILGLFSTTCTKVSGN